MEKSAICLRPKIELQTIDSSPIHATGLPEELFKIHESLQMRW